MYVVIVLYPLIAPVKQTEKFYAIRREYADISGQDALLIKIAKIPVIQIATVEKVFVCKEENAKIVIGACVI